MNLAQAVDAQRHQIARTALRSRDCEFYGIDLGGSAKRH
jgi:hypothetical protein